MPQMARWSDGWSQLARWSDGWEITFPGLKSKSSTRAELMRVLETLDALRVLHQEITRKRKDVLKTS
jgi:hypothetical protein